MKPKSKNEFKILIVYPNLSMMLVPSIAVGIFTRTFKQEGYRIELFDSTHYVSEENSSPQNRVKYLQARNFSEKDNLKVEFKTDLLGDFRKKVLGFKPDFMIFSVVEDAFLQTIKMLQSISDIKIPHLMGGIFPTFAPEVCLSFSDINMIGLGEGEETVVAVAEAIRLGKSLKNILGTWFKDIDGHIYKNKQRPLVDINKYCPEFSLFDETRFYRPMGGRIFKTIPVETYRGCPYSCTYCNSSMQRMFAREHNLGSFLRRKAVPSLHFELKELIGLYRPDFFYFIDDSFLARSQHEIDEFCSMYKEFKLPFWFNTRPENCTVDNLKEVKNIGCYRISFGIECGNEEYRIKVLKRGISNHLLLEKFRIIAESGIAFSINLIIGFPGETRDLIMDTVELVRSIEGYDTLTISIFTPYHGTVLREVAVKNNWLDSSSITKHTTARSMLTMPAPYISADEIDGLMRIIPLYCYFPKTEWKNILRAEVNDGEGNRVFEYYAAIYKENFLKQTQDEKKNLVVDGPGGCRTNPKDSFTVAPSRLSKEEIKMLT